MFPLSFRVTFCLSRLFTFAFFSSYLKSTRKIFFNSPEFVPGILKYHSTSNDRSKLSSPINCHEYRYNIPISYIIRPCMERLLRTERVWGVSYSKLWLYLFFRPYTISPFPSLEVAYSGLIMTWRYYLQVIVNTTPPTRRCTDAHRLRGPRWCSEYEK